MAWLTEAEFNYWTDILTGKYASRQEPTLEQLLKSARDLDEAVQGALQRSVQRICRGISLLRSQDML